MTGMRLSAFEAYTLVSRASPFLAGQLISARANDGIIVAKAQTLIWGSERSDDIDIPPEFWWARGHEALTQNWPSGDFETWIEKKIHCRAYGVSFREADIRAMLPKGDTTASTKTQSVVPTDEFLSAAEAIGLVEKSLKLSRQLASQRIVRYCAADLVRSQCDVINVTVENRYGAFDEDGGPSDLDHHFWEKLSFALGGVTDWASGRFFGRILDDGDTKKVRLKGVRFSASDIADLIAAEEVEAPDVMAPATSVALGGRPPSPFWDDLWTEICRALYVGDLKPARQADIERAMIAHVERQGFDVGVSTIRPRARKLWQAISRQDEN